MLPLLWFQTHRPHGGELVIPCATAPLTHWIPYAVYIEHEDTMFRNRVCEHACSSEHLLVYRGAIVGRLWGTLTVEDMLESQLQYQLARMRSTHGM